MKIDNNRMPVTAPTGGAADAAPLMATTSVAWDESTLQQVAERLAMLFELLIEANPQIQDPNQLTPGQTIQVPPHPFTQGLAAQPDQGSASGAAGADTQLARQLQASSQLDQLNAGGGAKKLTTIPPYDPRRGPQVTKDMWTDEMLDGPVTENQLRNIVDTADFLNARLERLQKPTSAAWTNFNGSTSLANASEMATAAQGQQILETLRSLGMSGGQVEEKRPTNPMSAINYGDDPRRHLYIGNLNVGLLMERYAKYPKELADRMTMAELGEAQGNNV